MEHMEHLTADAEKQNTIETKQEVAEMFLRVIEQASEHLQFDIENKIIRRRLSVATIRRPAKKLINFEDPIRRNIDRKKKGQHH